MKIETVGGRSTENGAPLRGDSKTLSSILGKRS